MGIGDFFFGQKQQNVPSLNDLIRTQQQSTPERIIGPGFQIQTRFRGGGDLRPEIEISEDADVQRARELRQSTAASQAGRLDDLLGGFQFGPIAADTAAADRVEQALFDRGFNLLEPIREQRRGRVEQRAADQGLVRGGEARSELLRELRQTEESELGDLVLRAILAREDALSSDINRQVTARGQQQAELSNFINQIGALANPGTPAPFFIPQSTLSGGDILAPSAQQGALDAQRQQGFADLLSGLISGGGRIGAAFAGG